MTEVVNIPSGSNLLHGVAHSPVEDRGQRIGILLSSANVNPKFGPHRLLYRLAEAGAEAGFYALRYDNRGTGDSPGFREITFADRIADARAALAFFRRRYRLDAAVGWGLCAGASVLVHCTASGDPDERPDGLVLCGTLAAAGEVWLRPYWGEKIELLTLVRRVFFDGNLLARLRQVPRKLDSYRESLLKLATQLRVRMTRRSDPKLREIRSVLGRVGELLGQYRSPCLIIFGEKDPVLQRFAEAANPGGQLGLVRDSAPTEWLLIKEGDHVFAGREQTAEVIRRSLEWLGRFRERHLQMIPAKLQSAVAS